jgi:hypothetical protein
MEKVQGLPSITACLVVKASPVRSNGSAAESPYRLESEAYERERLLTDYEAGYIVLGPPVPAEAPCKRFATLPSLRM